MYKSPQIYTQPDFCHQAQYKLTNRMVPQPSTFAADPRQAN